MDPFYRTVWQQQAVYKIERNMSTYRIFYLLFIIVYILEVYALQKHLLSNIIFCRVIAPNPVRLFRPVYFFCGNIKFPVSYLSYFLSGI